MPWGMGRSPMESHHPLSGSVLRRAVGLSPSRALSRAPVNRFSLFHAVKRGMVCNTPRLSHGRD